MIWAEENLYKLIKSSLSDHLFIVVSNREPYIHTYVKDEIKCINPASGVALSLDPIMRASEGVWLAHGSGDADKEVVDEDSKIKVPPKDPKYTLKRVWLTKQEEDEYYYGFSNEGLWPLCHIAYTRPEFNKQDFLTYKKINQKFADSILEEVGKKNAIVFIQDYHFALLPKLIKDKNPNILTAQFWHIPWPNREAFRICPWRDEILEGLLGNDLLGFHVRYHCGNFLNTCDRAVEAIVDYDKYEITRGGKVTRIRDFPISVDFEGITSYAKSKEIENEMDRFTKEFNLKGQIVGLGIDRIDYTKGIPERFRAIDKFFEKYPHYLGKVTFVQNGVLSRIYIDKYKDLNDELTRIAHNVNFKYQYGSWKPIKFVRMLLGKKELTALYRLADLCLVTSLHDGMNLVAKEYVSSKIDLNGNLILSKFTGASGELSDALLVNPYSIDEISDAIKLAIEMPEKERKKRMRSCRKIIQQNNIYRWAGKIIKELLELE